MIGSGSSYLPKRKAILAVADMLCVAGALVLSVALYFGREEGMAFLRDRYPGLLGAWLLFPVSFYVCGLYETGRLRRLHAGILSAAMSVTVGVLLGGTFAYVTGSFHVGRGIAVLFALILFAAILFVRALNAEATRRGFMGPRCLIIGTSEQAERVLRLVAEHHYAGLQILGRVTPGNRQRTGFVDDELPVLGSLDALEELVTAHGIDRLILAGTLEEEPDLLRRLRPLRYRGVALVDFVSLHEELAREIPLQDIDDEWLFRAAMSSSHVHIRRLKRLTDLVVSTLILIPVATLVFPVVALLIKMNSSGPAFFWQERLGLGSKPFMLVKFRTMRADAEKLSGPVWSGDNDPRITRVGRILRKFRIDELPQLINVLRGEMSLVGPRPERPHFTKKIAESVLFFEERLHVLPGITGWAQVMAPYASSIEDSQRKLQFDLYYAKHLSFFLDALIFVKTAKTMLFGRERSQGGMQAGRQIEASVAARVARAPVMAAAPAFAPIAEAAAQHQHGRVLEAGR
jgi:exopolysaccharide biosynthesis polyprenyl glycosylphosphotransferase